MGAWIETQTTVQFAHDVRVAPYMGAWIETYTPCTMMLHTRRTLYGCVD